MSDTFDIVLRGGTVVTPNGRERTDIGIRDGKFAGFGDLSRAKAGEAVDMTGLHLLPGVIDTQVHFREPGLEHKEDLESGTRGAVLGGVTGIFEMPNTKPLTVTEETFADKMQRADGRAWSDYAFYFGGTAQNAKELAERERLHGCAGIKIFMGSSTGDLLVAEDDAVHAVLAHGRRRVAVHSEDEARLIERKHIAEASPGDPRAHPDWRDVETALKCTHRLVKLARATARPVHVLHLTTEEELDFLAGHKDLVTCEATPQHLTFAAPEAYERLGTHAQMNPPIREERHRTALWRAIANGLIDVIGSDHAPHTAEEKRQEYPNSPSGMTGVQTLVPVMLDHVHAGRLSLERFVDLTSAGVQRLFNLSAKGRIALGYDADLTVVDIAASREIETNWIASKSGWTPYAGMRVTGWPVHTVIRGHFAVRDEALQDKPAGEPIRFVDTLQPGS